MKNRLIATGLMQHVIAVMIGEEWYLHFKQGDYAGWGLAKPTTPEQIAAGIPIVQDWVGRQQGQLKSIFNLPVVFLEQWINGPGNGPAFWHPVPPNTDVVALDVYVVAGTTFTTVSPDVVSPQVALEAAVQVTTLPLVIVPQWFTQSSGSYSQPPTQDTMNRYAAWLAHPQVIAMWGYTWESFPGSPETWGLSHPNMLPQLTWVKQSLGVP